MRLAVLGDIHGNHLALEAVLQAARARNVERLLLTGDFVGYYFWAREVLELLDAWDKVAVRGNHEDLLSEARGDRQALERITGQYGSGLKVALETLSEPQLAWLIGLPHPLELTFDGRRVLLCHGAPWDVDKYVYPDAKEEDIERCASGRHDWVILGHTHYSMQRQAGNTLVVNPGSVGQPRNRRPGAHWLFLDTASGDLEQRCEPYDIAWITQQSRSLQPGMPYLWNVLERT